MKPLPRVTGLAFLASVNCLIIYNLLAQLPADLEVPGQPAPPPTAPATAKPPIDATATISFGGNASVTAISQRGLCNRVGLQPDQVVGIAVQFSAPKAGHIITVEPLDGGGVIGTSNYCLVVGVDNTISFQYQAGPNPGKSQVCLHDGTQEIGFEFWVLDQQHPENNPPIINAAN